MRAFYVVELLRSTGEREFPAQLMAVFFWIASHEGCKQEEVAGKVHISPSSTSRCITWLGPRHRLEHRSGLRLVRRERDPDNYRAWRLYLTPKGRIFTELLDKHASAPLDAQLTAAVNAKKSLMIYDQSTDQDQDLGWRQQ